MERNLLETMSIRDMADIIHDIEKHLLTQGFTENTVRTYHYRWREFQKYALNNGYTTFEREWLLDFVLGKCCDKNAPRKKQAEYNRMRAVNLLCDYLKFGTVKRYADVVPDNELQTKIQELTDFMKMLNYSKSSIKKYRNVGNKLANYGNENGFTKFSQDWVYDCLPELFDFNSNDKLSARNGTKMRTAMVILNFERNGCITHFTRATKNEFFPPEYDCLFEAMDKYCAEHNVSIACCYNFRISTRNFARHLYKNDIPINKLSVDIIRRYYLEISKLAVSSKKLVNYILKSVLHKAYELGKTKSDLSLVCDMVRMPSDAKIPNTYSPQTIQSILDSVDRTTAIGKRDYALLLIAARYGIRACDIRNLKFENISWENAQIHFVQSKTKNEISFQISDEVGGALIDYLKNGRPISESKHIFVLHHAPYTPFVLGSNMQFILLKHLSLSGVQIDDSRPNGLHNFRHSLASNMLANGTALTTISEALGHVKIDSTKIYAKVDTVQLRQCALKYDI